MGGGGKQGGKWPSFVLVKDQAMQKLYTAKYCMNCKYIPSMFSIKTFIDNSNRDETAVRQNKIHKKNTMSKQPKMVWNKLLLILLLLVIIIIKLLLLLLLLLFIISNKIIINKIIINKIIIILQMSPRHRATIL